jgi:hypothetical protein
MLVIAFSASTACIPSKVSGSAVDFSSTQFRRLGLNDLKYLPAVSDSGWPKLTCSSCIHNLSNLRR